MKLWLCFSPCFLGEFVKLDGDEDRLYRVARVELCKDFKANSFKREDVGVCSTLNYYGTISKDIRDTAPSTTYPSCGTKQVAFQRCYPFSEIKDKLPPSNFEILLNGDMYENLCF